MPFVLSIQAGEGRLAEKSEAASSEASARAVMQSQLDAAQQEAARLSDSLLTEKARIVEAQHSWAALELSLTSRNEQLSSQLETSKASPLLSYASHVPLPNAKHASLHLEISNTASVHLESVTSLPTSWPEA